jgi:hypothetical protein
MKKQYNEIIAKINQAEKFINSHQDHDSILDFLAKFIKALDDSNVLIEGIERELGREMTRKEILEGFE